MKVTMVGPKVSIIDVAAAKGLEFRPYFLPGGDGLFPCTVYG